MTYDKSQHRAYKFGLTTMIVFVALTMIAMWSYPGGTNVDANTKGYLFTENFFSDLGRYRTFNGQPKIASMLLFMTALLGASLGTVTYFISAPKLFQDASRSLAIMGSVPGVLSGLCFAGVALTPWDLLGGYHGYFVKTAFVAFLITVFFYATAIFRSKEMTNIYAWTFLGYSIVLSGYLYLLFLGPDSKTPHGLVIQAVGQKIVVYSQILCMAIQLRGALDRKIA